MKNVTLQQLTEGIMDRNTTKERDRLVTKWNKTGLLRGLSEDRRNVMAQILENQTAEMLRQQMNESVSLSLGGGGLQSSGQIAGFTNIAFPIIRRVFGGLVANEIVSIQPMSLPSGLIFYLDYTYGSNVGGNAGFGLSNSATAATYQRGQSLYNNPTGKGVRSGSLAAGGMYDLVGTGYSRVHTSSLTVSGSGLNVGAWTGGDSNVWVAATKVSASGDFNGTNARMLNFDPAVESGVSNATFDVVFAHVQNSAMGLPTADFLSADQFNLFAFGTANGAVQWGEQFQAGSSVFNLRRLTKRGNWDGANFTPDAFSGAWTQFVLRVTDGAAVPVLGAATGVSAAISDTLAVDGSTGSTLTIPSFETDFGATPSPAIPDIDIKIESISITAKTRKLRARWSPELAQDLNAYHTLDAEVELTNILSEQVALEIDREILNDLLTQANGANFFWSRSPGRFVNKVTGARQSLANSLAIGPQFTGTVREWYETLVETVIDVANTIHRKTLRGSANFLVTGPDVCTILENTMLYRAKMTIDSDGQVGGVMTIGAENIGTVSNRFTVYKDPYFPQSRVLIGYKGGSYLESGYIYAPYVPLIVTPTIFSPEDFTPRRGVMTRYGKQMVRSDFFGTVSILDMNVI